ncbi:mitochondrial ATP synthase g subunit-domain-containing protein [Schizophyllum amplum]|uniref:Mitochondrial ATP synthase g subunit-domain-containing protein n=1 Tax=Schizophyllum amplum TaxID=97359 RepID=A0A550C3Q5_9AGAR|nr:mitochondrial ATP synthase g subunit-domain-containing protein [Auriculariopsis ampla]
MRPTLPAGVLRNSAARHSARPRSSPLQTSRFNSSKPNESLEEAQKKAKEAFEVAQKQGAKAWETAKAYSGPVQGYLQIAAKRAGPVVQRAGEQLGPTLQRLGPAGQKTAQFVSTYKGPTLYNLAVARELVKQVYRAEHLQPPTSWAQVKAAYETLYARATDRQFWRHAIATGEIAKIFVYSVEAYGIYKIGEMIGRRHIVGYGVPSSSHH